MAVLSETHGSRRTLSTCEAGRAPAATGECLLVPLPWVIPQRRSHLKLPGGPPAFITALCLHLLLPAVPVLRSLSSVIPPSRPFSGAAPPLVSVSWRVALWGSAPHGPGSTFESDGNTVSYKLPVIHIHTCCRSGASYQTPAHPREGLVRATQR